MIRVGVIGLSEGNGHPFSFSAILNGYDDSGLAESGWPVIYDYVRRRHPSEFGIEGVSVSHAWTQDSGLTRKLVKACRIPAPVDSVSEMLGKVDAVLLARDDYETHLEFALPFLEHGVPVLVDKPLCADLSTLARFRPYLETGQLMSCSAMRYAIELDAVRSSFPFEKLRSVRAAVLNGWEKYGIHMVDAILGCVAQRPKWVAAAHPEVESFVIGFDQGLKAHIDCLGAVTKTFQIDFYGMDRRLSAEISDNFSMFRRMLCSFFSSVTTARPAIEVESTLDSIRILIAGRMAQTENRRIDLDELKL